MVAQIYKFEKENAGEKSMKVCLPKDKSSGPSCSKLTTSLVKVSLKFQMLISENCQKILLKKCEKKSFSHFFNKKYQYIWLLSLKTLYELTY